MHYSTLDKNIARNNHSPTYDKLYLPLWSFDDTLPQLVSHSDIKCFRVQGMRLNGSQSQ